MNRTTKQIWLACALLGFGVLAAVFASLQIKQSMEADALRQFSFTCDQVALKIKERLGAYALTLRGGAALLNASDAVTRQDWRAYTEILSVQGSIPGVQGIGFAQVITPDQLSDHIARIRREGFPDYSLSPSGDRAIYTAVVYIEPFRDRNLRAFGYDMFSEPVRRTAMEQARDTGEAALSGKVELVQETSVEVQAGTLMYVPVYRKGMAHDTVEHRRAALNGWVYAPYRMNDLMAGILGDWQHREGQAINLQIYDGPQATPASLLFTSKIVATPDMQVLLQQQRTIDFNGRQWLLAFDRMGATFDIGYAPAWTALFGGVAFSILLFGLMLSVINTQVNAAGIANNLTQEIRRREQLLAESEYRWRFALEGAGDGVWDWSLADNTVFFSRRWKEMLGFSEDEIGNSLDEWKKRVHPSDIAETLLTLQAYFEGGIPLYATEHRVICKDGSYKWMLDRGVVVSRSDDGKPLRMIGTHTDITERKLLEDELRQSQTELQEAQRIAQVGSWQLDLVTNQVHWTEELYRIYGLNSKSPPPDYTEQFRLFTPSSWNKVNNAIAKAKSLGIPYELELETIRADGAHGWLWARGEAVRDESGAIVGLHGVAADITERKQAELMLKTANTENQRFRDALDHVSSYIYMKDTQFRYVYANRPTLELFGCSADELVGCDDSRFFPPDTIKQLREIDSRVFKGEQTTEEVEVIYAEGGRRVYLEVKTPIYEDGESRAIWGLMGISTDITALKENEQYLEHVAHYDALTGLPNRVLLADRLHQAMTQAQRRGRQLAVAYIDLDGFKAINDSHGHDAGDQLLMSVATNMKQALREGDTLARLGGDEFVAVLLDLADSEHSITMLTRLLTAAAEPVHFGALLLQVSASVGVTFYPQQQDDVDADQLLRQADQAMYQAKLAGKNSYHIFDTEQDRLTRGHHESLERIRHALAEREFVLYYQPKVNMRKGTVIGVEALIRWQHPDRGLLPPAVFLPVIEDHPLAVELGEWVIDTALTQLECWREGGLNIPVSVNVGARQLQQGDFVERLRTLLARYPGIKPFSLELEVLETSALADLVQISQLMEDCRDIGVSFALDDFGTGYSSLTYLKRLSADMLKIDQSFVRDMLEDPEDLAILEGVLGLAAAFRRQAIAEGVETVEHGEMLLQLGCELAQGYGIARPMPADELPEWTAVWKPDPCWFGLKAINRADLPLLYAGAELRAWADAFEVSLAGERNAPPTLDHHQCRFGKWLDSGGLAGRGSPSARQTIESLHRQVHELAAELGNLKTQGQGYEAKMGLGEFHRLKDALLKCLYALWRKG
ncbi:PAS domain S-box-containing protein/diguanylate cyclase (GGDEF)-like protein [Methylobacter tundripaludum]|uniref:PAS domain S-box-containing protein/diguanylate cyclase (GGDEF)-like protein n=1 Tax=Methylobacter tundripaludum TaxID=173365 RepID=A0A2S6H891_9GAMM|nr:EAL domain-containing protein [Methylobacter tundripaludum]PPK73651.1 PAS domain S-box-containing protein/diguanylate cyclase (GGDEF)-like protein [Methylobacter tundripaludum]